MRTILVALGLCLGANAVAALEVKTVPAHVVHPYPVNPQKGFSDLVLHTVAIATDAGESLTLRGLRIDVLKDGQNRLVKYVEPERLAGEAAGMSEMVAAGFGPLVGAQLLETAGLEGFWGRPVTFARSAALGPNETALATRLHLSLDFQPDEIRITANAVTASGAPISAIKSLKVAPHESPIVYRFPLDGTWLMHAIPSIESHHRLNPPTEFAVDFFKVDANGHFTEGSPLDAEGYFGYGAPVHAAADGDVVFVIADDVQDRSALVRADGESLEAAAARIGGYNMRRYAADLRRGAAGNIVTLRHTAGGRTEYSSYGHLMAGSVAVKVGDVVQAGDVIGAVGDTGDSPLPHLHIQINAGPDAFYSQSLPLRFEDLRPVTYGLDPGRFVEPMSAQ